MIRAHELAKELRISTMALKTHLTQLGVTMKSHMSFIDDEVAEKIRSKYKEQIAAEKKAQEERKHFIEMKHAAAIKAKQEEAQTQSPINTHTQTDITEAQVIPRQEDAVSLIEKDLQPESTIIPETKIKKEEIIEIRIPYQQATPIKNQTSAGHKPIQQVQKSKPEKFHPNKLEKETPSQSKLSVSDTSKKRTDSKQKNQYPPSKIVPPPIIHVKKVVPPPTISEPPIEPELKKFGKSKLSHEELGEKSKHRKALIKATKKPKVALLEASEIEEAEITRNIRRTLAKPQKRKKYIKETQQSIEPVSTDIVIREYTSVSELAKIMGVSASDIITKFFMMGQLVTMNQRLDRDSLEMICDEFNFNFRFEDEYGTDYLSNTKEQYSNVEYEPRPPVVTVMGHIDHGKTSILDYIRNTNVVAGESGGITQHIGAYQIEINKHKITFIDTPGHEAFTAMRARGANVTDIAVIVVSATEGVKPQTIEAIDHARAAGVSIIVAINKVDLPDANVDRVIAQLLDIGLYLETYGGEIPWCKTSVVTGEGILKLIELILLTAELKELSARKKVPAEGIVIEAEKDPRMGAIVTILIKEGTLSKGDIVVCGATYGRIRKIENERGAELKFLHPSDVGRLYGLNDVPKAGDVLNQVDNEKTARTISGERQQIRLEREKFLSKASLQNIFERIKEDKMTELRLIIKADTDGSVEALADSFQKLSNSEVTINIIHKSVGGINEADVSLASASDAIIIGFHVRANQQAKKMAEEEKVDIRIFQVIYAAIDAVKDALLGLLKPEYEEKVIGTVVVRQIFKIKKIGTIAGCFVEKGIIQRNCKIRLYRNDILLYEGKIASLKHYQNDVSKVEAGYECGLSLDNYQDIKENDIIECYVLEQVEKKLK